MTLLTRLFAAITAPSLASKISTFNTLAFKKGSLLLSLCLTLLVTSQAQAQFFKKQQPELLPAEEAFKVQHQVTNGGLQVNWVLADEYYMYRDKFAVELKVDDQVLSLPLSFSERGVLEQDEIFGEVEVFFFNISIEASLPAELNLNPGQTYDVVLKGQGCNKPVGICYPPMKRLIQVVWNEAELGSPATAAEAGAASTETNNQLFEEQKVKEDTVQRSFFFYVSSAFFAGILLSFTPCVLPMIPILTGVIAKQHAPSRMKSGWLAICYVAGTVVTYLIAGWIAGATGTQLQAYLQNPYGIGFVCLLLVVLAASLFGAFRIETPSTVQTKIHEKTAHDENDDAVLWKKSFVLGLFSALIVGACVSPILIIALGTAISNGDPVLGAAIMGSMALGMGVLLIAFGFGAGWLLPKTGPWMMQIQTLFGFSVLGVAIYIASALPAVPVLLLWSLLLIFSGFYVWQIGIEAAENKANSLIQSMIKSLALILIVWGCLAVIGHTTGGRSITEPLSELSFSSESKSSIELPFQTTTTLEETKQLLAQAKSSNQPAFVDFYADWCFDCVRMKRTTFKEQAVAQALNNWRLIEIDVTDTNADSEELKKYFGVFGPPASLFFGADGEENIALRQYGYIPKDDFISLVNSVR